MKANYCEGNSVEEYCLSFLCWSMYGMLKYLFSIRPTGVHLKEDSSMSNRHNPLWAVFYGITASICFLTRITNYVAITMLLIAIIIRLILKKEFINLFQNAIGYLGGVFAITAPFAAYFYLKGCFNDFLFGTFFFNIEYSDKVKAFAEGFIESISFGYFFQSYFTFGIVFVIAVIRFFKRDYYIAVTFLCSGMIEAYLFVNGSSFVQYPLVCIAQVPIFLGELYTIGDIRDGLQRYYGYSLYVISMFLTMLFICNIFSNDMVYVADLRKYYSTADSYTWKSLVDENIPEAEKDSFVAYGDNSLKGAYLLTDTLPACKYFTIQEWHALFSDKVSYDITAVYEKCQAKWILAYGPTSHIQKTLDEEYYVYDTKDDYYLYCLK